MYCSHGSLSFYPTQLITNRVPDTLTTAPLPPFSTLDLLLLHPVRLLGLINHHISLLQTPRLLRLINHQPPTRNRMIIIMIIPLGI